MNTLKFKTNINCNGCIAKVTPSLNGAGGIENWEVDTNNPQKIFDHSDSQPQRSRHHHGIEKCRIPGCRAE